MATRGGSIAAIGGGCVAVSRIGRLGAVDCSKADGGKRSSSVRGPGAPPAAGAGAIVGGSMGDGSNAEDNAEDAALIAANAVGGSHGGGAGRLIADGVGADAAASGGGGAAMVIGATTDGGVMGTGEIRATGRGVRGRGTGAWA